jgi:lysophospholipase L1-like esterase
MKLHAGVFLLLISSAYPQMRGEHWVATWATPQPLIRNQPAGPRTAPGSAPKTANPAQTITVQGFHNQTVRMIVHTTIGGHRVRVKFSNPFGGAPVTIGAAHVAIRSRESEIAPASDHALSFNGKPACTLGPGVVILSDPAELNIQGQSDLAISIYLPGETGPPSAHNGLHTSYVTAEGDQTGAATIPDALTTQAYYWLAGVDVLASADSSLIVAFGDSITEGARSTPDTDHMWPALLSARLAGNKATSHFAVVDMGIGGNRVLRDGAGASALARFDRDVLSQAGVKWVMILEGINDIGHGNTEPVTAEDLIGAFKQLIERAHTHGIQVVGCTLTPYEGAGYSRPEGESIREAFNTWIRTSGAFDAVVDFEAATRDSSNPKRIRDEFDPGDHLHPNDAGYRAMADAVDVSIFSKKRHAAQERRSR